MLNITTKYQSVEFITSTQFAFALIHTYFQNKFFPCQDSYPWPLVYQAGVLPTELYCLDQFPIFLFLTFLHKEFDM